MPFKTDVMENLNLLLVNRFDEILEVISQPGDLSFDVYVRTGVQVSIFVKKLNHYLLSYLKSNNWYAEPVYFNVYQNRELLNYLHYNDPDREFVLELEMEGEWQMLRVLDVMGASNDYSVFNSDFESIGMIHCEACNSFEPDSCFTYDDRLKPYIDQVVALMNEQILSHNH